jgi:hypothetical protein
MGVQITRLLEIRVLVRKIIAKHFTETAQLEMKSENSEKLAAK